jgi:hypothetical protein
MRVVLDAYLEAWKVIRGWRRGGESGMGMHWEEAPLKCHNDMCYATRSVLGFLLKKL